LYVVHCSGLLGVVDATLLQALSAAVNPLFSAMATFFAAGKEKPQGIASLRFSQTD
jgi:hypothetical protein